MDRLKKFFKNTTRSEWGYYIYGAGHFQSSVLISSVVTVLLEATAADSSFEADGITPCDTSVKGYKCYMNFLGNTITPTSYSLVITTVGHIVQAFMLIQFSGLSDHGNLRSILLLIFTIIGAAGSATIIFSLEPSGWYWVAVSHILISFASNVATANANSFLPILADKYLEAPPVNLGEVQKSPLAPSLIIDKDLNQLEKTIEIVDSNITFKSVERVRSVQNGETEFEAMERTRSRLSDINLFFCLLLGTVASAISAIVSFQFHGSNASLIWTFFISSLGWMVLGLIGWYLLQNKPGPPLKKPLDYITISWVKLYGTLKEGKKHSNVLILFMGWFFLLDSVSMMSIMVKLIGKVQVGLHAADFLLMACLTSPLEVVGIIFYNFIQKKLKFNSKQMILVHTVYFLIFPIYCFIGNFWGVGLTTKWEVYLFKLLLILPFSHLASVQRVLLSNFIPIGRETEFFSLNQVFGRGTAWIGPLLVGAMETYAGNIRLGFIFPIVFMLIGFAFFWFIDVEHGLDQAKKLGLDSVVFDPEEAQLDQLVQAKEYLEVPQVKV